MPTVANEAISDSDATSRALLSAVPDLIFRVRQDGTYVGYMSSQAERLYVPPQRFMGRKVVDVLPQEVAQSLMDCTRRALLSRCVQSCEYALNIRGKQGYFEARVVACGTDEVLHIVRDITDRKVIEEKLRLTQFAVDRAADGVFWIDRDARFVYVNDAACRSLGYSREELLKMTVHEIDPLFPPERWRTHWEEIGRRDSFSFESVHRRKSGETFPVAITVNCLHYAGWEYNCAFSRDITERKRIEQQLTEQNQFLHTVLESLTHPFYVIDAQDYTIKIANSAARAAGDIGPHTTCYALTHRSPAPCHVAGCACPLLEVKATGKPVKVEHVHYDGQGNPRTFEVHAYPIFDASGQVTQIIEYSLDVTEARRAQEALQQAKAAADAANAAKDHFLAVLSHELRTPLTPVLAATSVLQKDQRLPEDALEELSMIRRNVELEARLIDDLLDLTRISRGKLELRVQTIDLWDVLRHTLEIFSPEIDAKRLQVQLNLPGPHCYVHGDASRLQQVFWNLLKNAIKFTAQGGRVWVSAQSDEAGQTVVEVADNGVGIEPDLLPRLFNAFEQGGRSITRDFGGLGLGLAITKAIVEMHHGTITAASEGRGKGATFRVQLPAVRAPLAFAAREPTTDVPRSFCRPAADRPLRVLLVEDHADTARIMSQLLRTCGYEVRTADTAAAALEVGGREEFDLLISDLGLPDGSGLDLVQKLHRIRPALRSIALSGYGMDEDIARSRQAGFVAHVTKPINFEDLQAVIGRALV